MSRSRIVDFINREVQARRIMSQASPYVQLVLDHFSLPRENRNAIRGLIRQRVDRYNALHRPPNDPVEPGPAVPPVVAPVAPEVPAEPVAAYDPEDDVPAGQITLFEPCGNSTAFIDEHVIDSVELPQDLDNTLPENVVNDPNASIMLTDIADDEERQRIMYIVNYYNMMSLRRQVLFAAYVHLPKLRYDDATNSAITLNYIERNSVLCVFWGCTLNGRQFRDRTLARNRCIRLRNTFTNQQVYFSTHHTGWQLCNAFQVAYNNADFNVDYMHITRDDLLALQNTCMQVYANMNIEAGTTIVFPRFTHERKPMNF